MAKSRGEEHQLGHFPKSDGSDYKPNYIGPSWQDLIDLVNAENMGTFTVAFVGKIGYDSTREIDGISFVTTRQDLHAALGTNDPALAAQRAGDAEYVPYLVNNLSGFTILPEHVTGVAIRRND